MLVAALAMGVANSSLADTYFHFIHAVTGPQLTAKLGPMTVHLWINDALMAVFFLLVGLEIKREFVDGHLSTWADRRLPVIAAAAGMIVPAIVYLAVAGGDPALIRGWAIPAATDIAGQPCSRVAQTVFDDRGDCRRYGRCCHHCVVLHCRVEHAGFGVCRDHMGSDDGAQPLWCDAIMALSDPCGAAVVCDFAVRRPCDDRWRYGGICHSAAADLGRARC
jgi:Na+/H+ antiporter 1